MTSSFMLILLLYLSIILSAIQVRSDNKQGNEQENHNVLNTPEKVELKPSLNNPKTILAKNNEVNNIPPLVKEPQGKTYDEINVKPKHENSSSNANNVSWANVQQESGMLTKGMMLLLIVSLFFIMFVAYKTYRRKNRYARIKKYGVRLTKGNVEMRPLPLDNEDEDETIFDLKNVPT